jgi:CheY-like chemotaxis protein
LYGCTGLGLSITSKLVKRLGGSISLASEYGKFAEFTVDLPMNGVPIDVRDISSRLQKTIIVIVEPKREYNYSFTEYFIEEEPLPLSPAVADTYNLQVSRCSSLEDAYSTLATMQDASKEMHFCLLVHESLYSRSFDERLSSFLGQKNYTIMTHGPNYSVASTKDRHFKSLCGIFPASLLNAIAKHTKSSQSTSIASSAGAATGLFAALQKLPDTAMETNRLTPAVTPRITTYDRVSPKTPTKLPAKYDLKVLYAEDNVVNQKVLSRVLNRTGITDITVVDDGKKAVDVSAVTKFDCIFMDMQMPIMVSVVVGLCGGPTSVCTEHPLTYQFLVQLF